MSLKLPYRDVFYHKILRPLKLWEVLKDLDKRIDDSSVDISGLESSISSLESSISSLESSISSLESRVEALENNGE